MAIGVCKTRLLARKRQMRQRQSVTKNRKAPQQNPRQPTGLGKSRHQAALPTCKRGWGIELHQ